VDTVTIKPLHDRGHFCPVCDRVTIHHHIGPQPKRDGNVASHLWNCSECEATVALDSPEDVALRCFRRESSDEAAAGGEEVLGRRWR